MATVNLDTAARLDIVCRKGDSFSLTIEFDANMPNPADAGVTYTMVVRETDTSAGAHEDGFTFTRDGNDSKKITIANTATNMNVASGLYVYDLQVVNGSTGPTKTYLYGTFRINEDVS